MRVKGEASWGGVGQCHHGTPRCSWAPAKDWAALVAPQLCADAAAFRATAGCDLHQSQLNKLDALIDKAEIQGGPGGCLCACMPLDGAGRWFPG